MKRLKCVIVGDLEVGKTSLLGRFARPDWNGITPHASLMKTGTMKLHIDGEDATLVFWDITALSIYDRWRPFDYRETDVVLVCFSLVDPDTYDYVYKKWYHKLKEDNPHIPILLIGTKVDLLSSPEGHRGVVQELRSQNQAPLSYGECQRLREEIGAVEFIQCSANTKTGLENVLKKAATIGLGQNIKQLKQQIKLDNK